MVLSGSCSEATRVQVEFTAERVPVFRIDPLAAAKGKDVAAQALDRVAPLLGEKPVLVSATAPPEAVTAVQLRLGCERAGTLVEVVRGFAGRHHTVLLANHGPVVSDSGLDAAVNAIEELEEAAKLFLLLRGAKTRFLTPEQVRELL